MKPSGVFLVLLIALAFFTITRAQPPCPSSTAESSADPRDPYPNELDGYRFFRDGKLKNIRLRVSTRADVEKIFGPAREPGKDFLTYQYDGDWDITVGYYSPEHSILSYQREIDGVTVNYRRLPKLETIGKVQQISLNPKLYRVTPTNQGRRIYETTTNP
ncbi:MAG: hypothetical protein JSS81_09220 [Acidobacteria bacterium]|nr:hypothetical protein [Acidobacteriota bacterium]